MMEHKMLEENNVYIVNTEMLCWEKKCVCWTKNETKAKKRARGTALVKINRTSNIGCDVHRKEQQGFITLWTKGEEEEVTNLSIE